MVESVEKYRLLKEGQAKYASEKAIKSGSVLKDAMVSANREKGSTYDLYKTELNNKDLDAQFGHNVVNLDKEYAGSDIQFVNSAIQKRI